MAELIEIVKKLQIVQNIVKKDIKEVKEDIKKIKDKDGEIKESQRKLAKLFMLPRFKRTLTDLDGWIF